MGTSASQEAVDMNSDEAKFVQNTINSNCVVIFSKTTCLYCSTAKQLFRDIGAPNEVVELNKRSDGNLIQAIVSQISGIATVPQVFINGKCIGGCSETKSLHKNGQLITMLRECGIL